MKLKKELAEVSVKLVEDEEKATVRAAEAAEEAKAKEEKKAAVAAKK